MDAPRRTSIVQQLRATLSRNESFSSFESAINQLSVQQSKFCSTFIENWEVFQVNVSSHEIMSTPHIFGSKFVTYRLKVLTDHLCYYVDKRYRDFLDLYNSISKFFRPKTIFPKKTHIKSKVCPFLTESRKKAFDAFMSEIISMRNSNKSVFSQLIMFLDIKNHYNANQMDQNVFLLTSNNFSDYVKDRGFLLSHLIRHQMLKINYMPNQSLRFLPKLQFLVNNLNRCYSKVQDLKIIIAGAHKVPGLIETAVSNPNEIVGLSFIKFIKKLLKAESCPYAQNFKKVLESAPSNIFILHYDQSLQNQQFAANYFELIDIYLKIKTQNNIQLVSEEYVKQFLSPWTALKFFSWIQDKNSIQNHIRRNTTTLMKIQKKQFQQPQQIQKQVEETLKQSKKVFQKQLITLSPDYVQLFNQNKSFCQVSSDKKFMHFCFFTSKGFDDLTQSIKKWKHNGLVKSYFPSQIFTNICKIFFLFEGKSEKLFQFQQKTFGNQKQKNQKQRQVFIHLSPPEEISNVNSFFYNATISELKQGCKVQMLYYFHSKKSRKLFQEELNGKSNKMWTSGCEEILDQFQIYTQKRSQSSPAKTSQTP